MFILSWIVYPLVVLVVALGAGLGLRRAASLWALPGVLVLPAGIAAIVTVSALTTQFDATAELTWPAILAISVAGFVSSGRSLLFELRPQRRWIWPAVAALLPALSVAAPVVLTGQPGLTGYTRIPDLMHQLQFTDWITHGGRDFSATTAIDSSYLETVVKMLGVGYPGGAQAMHGGTSALIGIDPLWSYQAFMAIMAASVGLALYSLLGRAISSRPWRALAAGVAAQPTILYSYAINAGIKELAAVTALTLVAALLYARRPGAHSLRGLIPLAVAIASSFAVFSLGILPWLGMLLGIAFLADLIVRGPRIALFVRWGVLAAGVALLSIPTIDVARKLAPVAASGGPVDLGNLSAPISALSAVGPWLTSDHRWPLDLEGAERTPTYVLASIVLAFALLGLLRALRQRDLKLLAIAATAAVALVYVSRRSGPWVDLKAYTITAPLVLMIAFTGAAALWRVPRLGRVLAPVAILVIAASVLGGNALVYRDSTVTPHERFAELERIGDRFAGQGPALHTSLDDYPEYLLRDLEVTGMFNPPRPGLPFRAKAYGGTAFTRDLDGFESYFVQKFPLLVLRRDPTTSHPPANFRLVSRMKYYDVWRRTAPSTTIVEHVPLVGEPGERTPEMCGRLVGTLRRAGPGAQLAVASAPDPAMTVLEGALPPAWVSDGADYFGNGPGRLILRVTLPKAGRYKIWLRGSVGRKVLVEVDRKPLTSVRLDESFPFQYIPLSTRWLSRGTHSVELVRGGGSLLPSTGNDVGPDGATTRLGPLAFVPAGDTTRRIQWVSEPAAMKVCRSRARLDWMEIVRR